MKQSKRTSPKNNSSGRPMLSVVRICLLVLGACPLHAEDQFYFRSQDRVVFYGDRITQPAFYPAYIETYVVSPLPTGNIQFIDSGWAGDWVVGGEGGGVDERLARDVIAHRPTVVTVMLGMNDGGYQKFDQALFDGYSKGYEHLVDSLQKALPDLRITLMEPSPFDDVTYPPQFEGGYNATLMRYGADVRQLADKHHLRVVDLNGPLVSVLQKAKTENPSLTQKVIDDRIHPTAAGHLIMAALLLNSWNAPAIVSNIEIDLAR